MDKEKNSPFLITFYSRGNKSRLENIYFFCFKCDRLQDAVKKNEKVAFQVEEHSSHGHLVISGFITCTTPPKSLSASVTALHAHTSRTKGHALEKSSFLSTNFHLEFQNQVGTVVSGIKAPD